MEFSAKVTSLEKARESVRVKKEELGNDNRWINIYAKMNNFYG